MRPRLLIALCLVLTAVVGGVVLWPRGNSSIDGDASPSMLSTREAPKKPKTEQPAKRSRALLGEVTTPDGAVIADVTVAWLAKDGSALSSSTTDDDGQFSLDRDAERAAVSLRFRAAGYTDAVVDAAMLPAVDEAFWSQVLTVDASARVVTVVVGDAPVEGAVVFFDDDNSREGLSRGNSSDAKGRVVINADDAKGHDVLLGLDARASKLVIAHLAHGARLVGEHDRVIALDASVPFEIKVTSAGAPVASANVHLSRRFDGNDLPTRALRQLGRRVTAIATDDTGRVLWPTQPGDVTVSVAAPGYAPVRDIAATVTAHRPQLVVKLEPSVSIHGVVVDAVTKAPVDRARVRSDGTSRAGGGTETDDDGRFLLSEVPARMGSLTVRKRGYVTLNVGVDGTARNQDALVIELQPGEGEQVAGIGVGIERHERGVVVRHVEDNSPAHEVGIVAGEIITAANGVSFDDDIAVSMGLIRGAIGTSVRLTVVSDAGERTVDVVRARVSAGRERRNRRH